jgi:hypothetical protein
VLYNRTVIHQLRRKILDTLSIFTINNGYKELEVGDLDIVTRIENNMPAS